jgi:hypothetical protein
MSSSSNRRYVTRLLFSLTIVVVVTLALGATHAQSNNAIPEHFSGTISEYSPSNVSGGPWEVRGKWTVDIHGAYADFAGAAVMETSDYGVTTKSIADPTMVMDRNSHTHNITMTNIPITVATAPVAGCPTYNAPTPAPTGPVIVIYGPVNVTSNGQPAPFEAKGPSWLRICITGGTVKPWTNFGMIFTGTATSHFGSQFYNGVVTSYSGRAHDFGLPAQ